jgi:hypothetical protein
MKKIILENLEILHEYPDQRSWVNSWTSILYASKEIEIVSIPKREEVMFNYFFKEDIKINSGDIVDGIVIFFKNKRDKYRATKLALKNFAENIDKIIYQEIDKKFLYFIRKKN